MDLDEKSEWRRARLYDLAQKFGGNAALGRLLDYKDGAFVGQMIRGIRPITEKTINTAEALPGCAGWFSAENKSQPPVTLNLDEHPDLVQIRKVSLRLQAGIEGFAIEPEEGDGPPIFFRADWMQARGYKPYKLLAIRVKGSSMEDKLNEGDTVVVNTADVEPADGEVFAVNYEGEPVVKRLVRDGGLWWLSSDNPDQRRYPRKECKGDACILVGRVVHKQSERI